MRALSDASSKARLWAALGIVVLSLLWGYTWVVAKQALDYAPPFTLTFMRVFGGALALFLALKLLRQPLRLQAPRAVLLISLCQVSGFMLLQTLSLKFGAAGKTAVLVYTMPIWTLSHTSRFQYVKPCRRPIGTRSMAVSSSHIT